ncbi:T. brucei spp.-specific protein [Trypanosoma brucei gambiense DAL972]|uniref:T. brucei spp.-specific protein n=1 Tax=Trypanosoma brucei gambiense (strain MHOM/CI/86/DAL972) TaxID=679716 RepID=D0A3T0_TRYB9|nr:T. brucei spp.-specific protein [Trypanosoma brucei gambiense DAL972]CBH15924.1 T. brucei spp.-specific protein [Trypanosoma brucei gambiense DAL972]|eukprot:XP_011778188.1 T. brucei spp.-specific protein [Trypanosoma brucei gambiense DAL972]
MECSASFSFFPRCDTATNRIKKQSYMLTGRGQEVAEHAMTLADAKPNLPSPREGRKEEATRGGSGKVEKRYENGKPQTGITNILMQSQATVENDAGGPLRLRFSGLPFPLEDDEEGQNIFPHCPKASRSIKVRWLPSKRKRNTRCSCGLWLFGWRAVRAQPWICGNTGDIRVVRKEIKAAGVRGGSLKKQTYNSDGKLEMNKRGQRYN